jgi:5-formyltetrahydrofolate cyclo-ligase
VKETKRRARADALSTRAALEEVHRHAAGESITRRLADLTVDGGWRRINSYVGFGHEAPTRDFLVWALSRGLEVFVPVTDPDVDELLFSHVHDLRELRPGTFGVPEPAPESLRPHQGPFDVVLIPGCLFDLSGNRLGYGRGFYDRFLASVKGLVPLVGVAFEAQLAESVPMDTHDVPVDALVTERATRFIANHHLFNRPSHKEAP